MMIEVIELNIKFFRTRNKVLYSIIGDPWIHLIGGTNLGDGIWGTSIGLWHLRS